MYSENDVNQWSELARGIEEGMRNLSMLQGMRRDRERAGGAGEIPMLHDVQSPGVSLPSNNMWSLDAPVNAPSIMGMMNAARSIRTNPSAGGTVAQQSDPGRMERLIGPDVTPEPAARFYLPWRQ